MARIKIDYGIDLGTTNSAICRMEKGEPVIIKSDTLKDTMPSCVSINKKKSIRVGDGAYNDMKSDKRRASKSWKKESSNTYVEFKRTMGTNQVYDSSNLGRTLTSEELSAEVLKTLKSFVTDESFRSVVITVPAKFTVNQKTATMEAAKMAGFDHCELLQEPIAASMAYGLTSDEKNGYWMVFDFGGGTFDAALLKVEDGIMQVFDTEGDNYLGGKNLDYAIVDDLIIPYLKDNYSVDGLLSDPDKKLVLRDAMKSYAEEVKNQLSFKDSEDIISNLGDLGEDEDGEEIELDITLTQEQVFAAMRPHFQKAVDICKTLLKRNNMTGDQINKIIMVGGPTHSPLIRQMLRDQISPNVDTSIDPMSAVATGAALYASTIDAEVKKEDLALGTVHLKVGYESTSVETSEWVSVQLDKASTGVNCPDKVYVEFVSSDKTWSSGKQEIDETGNVVEVILKEGKANSFSVLTYDEQGTRLDSFPSEITIIQGSKVGAAPLPYYIGIEIWNEEKEKLVFEPIEGLEKNKPLPATGVANGFKTTSQLRPGNDNDKLVIPIYQADESTEGTSSKLYEYVTNVVFDGSEVENLIPEGSTVDITIKVNSSEMMVVGVYFPSCDLTLEKELDTSKKQSLEEAQDTIKENFREAQRMLDSLSKAGVNVSEVQEKLNGVKTENENNTETKMILQHQKEVMREIENLDNGSEFDRIEKELKGMFNETEQDQKKYGNFQTGQILEQLRSMVNEAISKRDSKMAREVLEQLRAFDYKLAEVEYYVVWILGWHKRFEATPWKDKGRARQLVNQGLQIINDNPTAEKLDPIVDQLIDLLPPSARPDSGGRVKK